MKYDVTAIVERTEHILKCRHDETLMETNAARLHDCLGEAVMLAISDQWARLPGKRGRPSGTPTTFPPSTWWDG